MKKKLLYTLRIVGVGRLDINANNFTEASSSSHQKYLTAKRKTCFQT